MHRCLCLLRDWLRLSSNYISLGLGGDQLDGGFFWDAVDAGHHVIDLELDASSFVEAK